MAGIYLHIPFCKQACHYCDFHFSTRLVHKAEMVDCLIMEMKLHAAHLKGQSVNTIYFGGGTPSILEAVQIEQILEGLSLHFSISENPEITLEANPDDLSLAYLKDIRLAGINRLSIGIQSFDEEDLKFMNRAHNATQSHQALGNCREAGFDNLSIDLIYGLPNRDENFWRKQLETAWNYRPDHISAYALTVEEKTAYDHYIKQGIFSAPDDEISLVHFKLLTQFLQDKGYEHYEISNFAQAGKISQHNSNYWRRKHYLGLGPGAHSFFGNFRQWNVANNALYMKKIKANNPWYQKEELSLADQYNEYIMTRLRTNWGLDTQEIEQEFGPTFLVHFNQLAGPFLNAGKLKQEGPRITLSPSAKFLADGIAADLFFA